ncbi:MULTISPECIES: hypothetical protein [unclassified Sphingopyxis]|uniref:hypothetical protein n=1 Tax=Sphingopyxis sp. YF1 TaxID=2482763 RepID=UPI001F621BA5|nr:hypothetical protein [Sphingopyxis sp. YF1]
MASYGLKFCTAVAAFCALAGTARAEEQPMTPEERSLLSCAMQAVTKAREAVRTSGKLLAGVPHMKIYDRIERRIYEVLTAKGWTEDEVSELLDEWYDVADYGNAAASMADVCKGIDPALWQ